MEGTRFFVHRRAAISSPVLVALCRPTYNNDWDNNIRLALSANWVTCRLPVLTSIVRVGGVFEWTRVVAGASNCVVIVPLLKNWTQLNQSSASELRLLNGRRS